MKKIALTIAWILAIVVGIFLIDVIREASKPTLLEELDRFYLEANPHHTKADLDASKEKFRQDMYEDFIGKNDHQAQQVNLSDQMKSDLSWAKKHNEETKELIYSKLGESNAKAISEKNKEVLRSQKQAFHAVTDDFDLATKLFLSSGSKAAGINHIVSGQINDSIFSALPGVSLTSAQKEKFLELLKEHCATGYDDALTEQDIYCLCLMFSAIKSDDRVNVENIDFEKSFSGWSQKDALQKMQLAMNDAFRKSMTEINTL